MPAMSLVPVAYVLLAIQLVLFLLYVTGRWFLIPVFFEVLKILFQIQIHVLRSAFKWIAPSRKDLASETALITGAGSGIGRLIALLLAKKGCKVILWDINFDAVRAVAKEISSSGGAAFAYKCDVCDRGMVSEVAAKVKDQVGDVSLLINNAGIVSGKKLLECSEQEIDKTFQVNSLAHFWTIKAFLPGMLERNHGHIVSTASVAGYIGLAGAVDYCSSKFAAVGLMQSLRCEVSTMGKDGVHFTTICPSLITTGMFQGVKFRFPHLPGFAVLKPEYAATRVVDAIEKEQILLMMPWGCYLAVILQSILPEKATDALLNFLGSDIAMDTFVGRQEDSKAPSI